MAVPRRINIQNIYRSSRYDIIIIIIVHRDI